jgi:hypothetical protein
LTYIKLIKINKIMTNNTIDNVQKSVEGAVDNVVHTFDRKDTHSYKGWLNSDSFMKRAFAVLGYNTVASLIIMIPLYALMFAAMLFFFGMASRGEGMRYDKEFGGQYENMNFPNNAENADYQNINTEDPNIPVQKEAVR